MAIADKVNRMIAKGMIVAIWNCQPEIVEQVQAEIKLDLDDENINEVTLTNFMNEKTTRFAYSKSGCGTKRIPVIFINRWICINMKDSHISDW